MPSAEVYQYSKWSSLDYLYKLRLIKLFDRVVNGEAPAALPHLADKACVTYSFRRSNNITVPRFNSNFVLKIQLATEVPSYETPFLHSIRAPNFRISMVM